MVRDPKEKRGVTLAQAKNEDQRLFHGSQRGENPILPFFDHREMIMNNLVAIPMQVQVAFDATSRLTVHISKLWASKQPSRRRAWRYVPCKRVGLNPATGAFL
jgi:hypothetical protein